eukprot:COSAG01_NODE_14176_length_1487_cov_1.286023_2_plen_217_part_00
MERRRYEGETVDNTLSTVLVGWDTSGYREAGKGWLPAVEYEALAGRELTPSLLEPITRVEEIHPVSFTSHGSGKFSWAFSQNFGGFAELNVPARGFTNTTLTVQVGEERDPSGWPTNGHGWWTGDGHLSWKLRGTEKLEMLRPTFMFTGLQFIGEQTVAPLDRQKPLAQLTKLVHALILDRRVGLASDDATADHPQRARSSHFDAVKQASGWQADL